MTDELYENLKEIYDSFFNERQELKEKLDSNLNTISQIESYLESLFEQEESDYKFFSPRNVKAVYKEDIEKNEIEKRNIENENHYYYKKINLLDSRIQTLSSILNSIGNSNSSNEVNELDKNGELLNEKSRLDKKLNILDIQEKERHRIARDLHDTSLQNLAHLVHKIELASKYVDQDTIQTKLELAAINKNLKTIIQDIRNTIFDLRPMSFDDLGLKETFERLIDKLKQTSGFSIQTDIEDIKCDNQLVLMTIYRIVEECLNNAIKHSKGDKVFLSFKLNNNHCNIVIKDNGQSFNCDEVLSVKDKHFGLCILKERVELLSGSLIIDSKVNNGTTINITIPLLSI